MILFLGVFSCLRYLPDEDDLAEDATDALLDPIPPVPSAVSEDDVFVVDEDDDVELCRALFAGTKGRGRSLAPSMLLRFAATCCSDSCKLRVRWEARSRLKRQFACLCLSDPNPSGFSKDRTIDQESSILAS